MYFKAAFAILFGIISAAWSESFDECRNDAEVQRITFAGCSVVASALVSWIGCTTPPWDVLCPMNCGTCDQFPPPICDVDDVYAQKVALIEVMQVAGLCMNCTAPPVWTEHKHVVLPSTETYIPVSRTWTSDWEGDPCNQRGVTCNRCGEPIYLAIGFPQGGFPVMSHVPLALGQLHQLEELVLNAKMVGELPPPTDPGANYIPAAMWSNFSRIGGIVITDMVTGDVPDFSHNQHLVYSSLTNNRLYGKAESLFGPAFIFFLFSQDTVPLESGPLPDSVCNSVMMFNMVTADLNLRGPLPSCMAPSMQFIQVLQFHGCSLSGEIGQLAAAPMLRELRLDHNSFTGTLPETMSQSSALRIVSFSGNQISGTLPDLSRHTDLTLLDASHNQLVSAKALSGSFLVVDLSDNLIEALPDTFLTLNTVASLNLQRNRLSWWPPANVYPRGSVSGDTALSAKCFSPPKHPPFTWPMMDTVLLSGNDFKGQDVRDILGSLAGLPRIRVVEANDCNISMDLPMETLDRMLPQLDFAGCDFSISQDGFPNLNTLRLSGNRITGFGGAPWGLLQILDITKNDMRHVHPGWFDGSSSIIAQDYRGNPALHLPVQVPLEAVGCQDATILTANPRSFLAPSADAGYECTSLCSTDGISTSVDSSLNISALCRCRPGWYGSGTSCTPCRQGFFCSGGVAGGETQCPLNSDTQGMGAVIETDCECNPGFYRQFASDGTTTCELCPANTYRPTPNARSLDECFACSLGTYSNPGTTGNCLSCEDGTVPVAGGAGCEVCTAGTFANSITKACEPCPLGQYQSNDRTTACIECIGFRNTTWSFSATEGKYVKRSGAANASACGCDEGYRPEDGSCVQCGVGRNEGLSCSGGLSTEAVTVIRGYYAPEAPPISVFRCWGEERRCQGGLPGQTCGANRFGVSCGLCEDGYVDDGAGRCIDCDEASVVRLLIAGVVVLAAAIGFYDLIDRHSRVKQKRTELIVSSVMSLTVTVLQQLALLSQMSIEWSNPLKSLLETFTVLNFDLRLIHADCIRNMKPTTNFNMRICMIFGFCALMTAIHIMFVFLRHGGRFKARRASLVCCLGGVATVLYISVVITIVAPFNCLENPNDKLTMQAFPSVVCWESSEHAGMIISSCIGLIMPLAYYAHAGYTVWRQPAMVRTGDGEFQKAYEFYFVRFKIPTYWFILVQIGRNLAVSLTIMIPDSAVSIFVALLVIGGYGILTAAFYPWREPMANRLDILLTACVSILFSAAFRFITESGSTDRTISLICVVAIIAVVSTLPVTLFIVIARTCCRKRRFDYFLCHHKVGAGAFVRLLKVWLTGRHNNTLFQTEVFLDADSLAHLDQLFGYVRAEVETMVAVWSRELLMRPWCAGELTIARLSHVRTVVIQMPDQEPVTHEFIVHYEENVTLDSIFEYGLTLELVHETLGWISGNHTVIMAGAASPLVMEGLTSFLSSSAAMRTLSGGRPPSVKTLDYVPGPIKQESNAICADETNSEAIASGMVLERFLTQLQAPAFMLSIGHGLPKTTKAAVWLCSGGCMRSPPFLILMSSAASTNLRGLPVVVQESFRFPTAGSIRGISSPRSDRHSDSEEETTEADQLSNYIYGMFKGIAVEFQAQMASEGALKLASVTIMQRLTGSQTSARCLAPDLVRGGSSQTHTARTNPSMTFGNLNSLGSERSVGSSVGGSLRNGVTSSSLPVDDAEPRRARLMHSTEVANSEMRQKGQSTSTYLPMDEDMDKLSQRSSTVTGQVEHEWDMDDCQIDAPVPPMTDINFDIEC